MEMYKLLALADDTDKSFDGLFSGAGHIVGIVLAVTGLLLLYIAFKVSQGYSFIPTLGSETVIKEDNYVEGTAKAVEKIVTKMPDPNGGEDREFVEWKIVYTANGEEYSQEIPDDGYSEGDNIKIKYEIGPRRSGDVATCFSDPTKAEKELGWKAEKNIDDMCRDSWNWQKYASENNL